MTEIANVDGYNINKSDIDKVINTDVLVIGAGNAGMMAGAAAQEKGAKVIIIEKEDKIALQRWETASVGSNAQKRVGVTIDKKELVEYLAAFAHHKVDQRLLKTWVDNSAEAINWWEDKILKPHGAYLHAEPDAMVTSKIYRGYPTENDPTTDDESYVSYNDWFTDYMKEHGVEIRFKTSLVHLIKQGNTVTGAIVKDLNSNKYYEIDAAKGVIICTGGYSANKELLKKWNPEALKECVYNDSPRNNGAGIVESLNVGALRDQQPASIIFDRGLVPVGTKTDDMYYQTETYDNWLWIGSYPFLKVNLRGERFANESIPYQFITNAASEEPGYLYAMIMDADWADRLEKFHMLGCAKFGWPGYMKNKQAFIDNVESNMKNGLIVKADTIEELAKKLHLPVKALENEVNKVNEDCKVHADTEFGKEFYRISPIKKAPYYGCILGGRLLATFDGLRVNNKMEVLDTKHDPINHLYAAGNDSGGFFFDAYPDRVPGLAASHAKVFGRLAGKYAAEN